MVGQEQLMQWARHPDLLDKGSLYELRKVVNAYPYYQLARILLLKNLYLLNMPDFQSELKKGVLYVADASLLFYYLEGDKFAIDKQSDEIEEERKSGLDRTLALIDTFLKEDETPAPDEMKLVPETSVDYSTLLMKEEDAQMESAPQLRGQSLIDDFLKQAEDGSRPLYRFDSEETITPQHEEADSLEELNVSAEDVLDEPQKEQPDKDTDNQVELGETDENDEMPDEDDMDEEMQSDTLEDSSLSETLAKIYVKQQKYDKALEIIKKLNLKNPKKNAYFADQIRFLEKLIINTKSK